MHMLHTRRKAEIEILSTAKLIQPPRLFHDKLDGAQPKDTIARQTSPLLDYLLKKIMDFVDTASCKAWHRSSSDGPAVLFGTKGNRFEYFVLAM